MNESELTFNINLEKHIAASSQNKAMLWFFLRTLPPIFKIREKESETSFEEYLRLKYMNDGLYHLFVSIKEAKRINSVIKSDLNHYSKKSTKL